jgi:hypothetical protein
MITVKIDHDTADRITVCTLRESIKTLKNNIDKLNQKKKLKKYEIRDLQDNIKCLAYLEGAYDYYGGNLKEGFDCL